MIKNSNGIWEKTDREVIKDSKVNTAKDDNGKATTKDELLVRVAELEELLRVE